MDLDIGYSLPMGARGGAMKVIAEEKRQESLDRLAFRKIYGALGHEPLRSLDLDAIDADGARIYGQEYLNRELDVKWVVRRFETGRTFSGVLPALWTLWRKPKNRLPEYEALTDFAAGWPDSPVFLVTKYADRSEMIAYGLLRGRGGTSGHRLLNLVGDGGEETGVMALDDALDVAAALLGRNRNESTRRFGE